ncbi:hypothetical protein KSS87_020248 [Heliosperma pusillum]|nr:hypothetical protein KSS87_020248 [Heliosperma pusillum]
MFRDSTQSVVDILAVVKAVDYQAELLVPAFNIATDKFKQWVQASVVVLKNFKTFAGAGHLKNMTANFAAGVDTEKLAIMVDESANGFKTIVSFDVKAENLYKVEHQLLLQNAVISWGADISASPIVDFSCAVGNTTLGFGTELSVNTASNYLTKFNVGLNYTNAFIAASLNVKNKGKTLEGSVYRDVNSEMRTAVGVELVHNMATEKNTLTVGTQHVWDPFVLVKSRINNYGIAGALVQYQCSPKTLVTISGELHPLNKIRLGFGLTFTLSPCQKIPS